MLPLMLAAQELLSLDTKTFKEKAMSKDKVTQCFSYEVVMLVHIIADDEKQQKNN